MAGEARRLRSCGLGAAMLRPLQHLEEGFGMSMNATTESDAAEEAVYVAVAWTELNLNPHP